LETADLHIIRKEVGIEYVGTVTGAEIGNEIASEVLAESLDAFRYIPIEQFGDHGYE